MSRVTPALPLTPTLPNRLIRRFSVFDPDKQEEPQQLPISEGDDWSGHVPRRSQRVPFRADWVPDRAAAHPRLKPIPDDRWLHALCRPYLQPLIHRAKPPSTVIAASEYNNTTSPLASLPEEILDQIVEYIGYDFENGPLTQYSLSQACAKFRRICPRIVVLRDDTPHPQGLTRSPHHGIDVLRDIYRITKNPLDLIIFEFTEDDDLHDTACKLKEPLASTSSDEARTQGNSSKRRPVRHKSALDSSPKWKGWKPIQLEDCRSASRVERR